MVSIKAGGNEGQKCNSARGRVLFVTHPGSCRAGEPRAPAPAATPGLRAASGAPIAAGGPEAASGAVSAGWDGRKRGEGAAGGGRRVGTRAESAARVRRGERRARAARALEAPERLLLPGLEGDSPALVKRKPDATRHTSRGRTRAGHAAAPSSRARIGRLRVPDSHKLPPARRGHCSPRASYLHGAGGSGSCSRPPGLQLRALGGRGRGGPAARAARTLGYWSPAGGRQRRGRAHGAGGGRRGPSYQRWRGAEGGRSRRGGWERAQGRHGRPRRRAERRQRGRSGAKRVAAASPPPRASRALPAALRPRRPRRLQAGEREVKAGELPLGLGRPSARGGEPQRRAARAAGTAGEPQPLQRPRLRPASRRTLAPAPLRPGGQVRPGAARRERPPRPGEPTSDPRPRSCGPSRARRLGRRPA